MNRVRQVWADGRAAVLGWLHIPSAFSAEALAHCGYDGLVIDLQHGAAEASDVAAMLMAIECGGAEPFVRVTANAPAEVMKVLDLGAYGVIAPLVESAAEASRFAAALHYPPRGMRSFGPRRPLLRYGGDYLAAASSSVVSLAMIESVQGLEDLDAILAVADYDGVFIGPSDLALSLGRTPKPDSDDPHVQDVIAEIRTRCKAAGKRVGLFCVDPQFARAKIAEGFDLVSIAPDLTMLTSAAKTAVQVARALPSSSLSGARG